METSTQTNWKLTLDFSVHQFSSRSEKIPVQIFCTMCEFERHASASRRQIFVVEKLCL